MDSVKYILGLPEVVEGIGEVWPVRVRDYDEFMQYSSLLIYASNEQLDIDPSLSVLDVLILGVQSNTQIIDGFFNLFKLVLRKDLIFDADSSGCVFRIDDEHVINGSNFAELRKTIMKQNLLYAPRKYKTKFQQEWADKALKLKMKNGLKIDMEAMVNTVSVLTCKPYAMLADQTIYQLTYDFKRIMKLKDYETNVAFKCAGAEKINLEYFAEQISLFVNPYDSAFVSSDKISGLISAVQGQ